MEYKDIEYKNHLSNMFIMKQISKILTALTTLCFLVSAQPCHAELKGFEKIAPYKVAFYSSDSEKMLLHFLQS